MSEERKKICKFAIRSLKAGIAARVKMIVENKHPHRRETLEIYNRADKGAIAEFEAILETL